MSEPRRVRDPIHGFVELAGDEIDIVGTPVFQRLRGIRQLAFAYLVYPSALHTRFEHTLGVFHVTNLLCDVFRFNNDDRKLVKLAALLHDLGHGPFSHVSEDVLDIFAQREKLEERLKSDSTAKIHELVTQDILQFDPDLQRHVAPATMARIQQLLSDGYGEPVLRSVVSGPLDADKQDYLLRDSYFCGVKYGVFDIQQLHRVLAVLEDRIDGRQLMISSHGVHALEQFVLAKHYLTAQVYKHRIRLITDQMIVRAIVLGIEQDNLEELRMLYSYDGRPEFVANYCSWSDARLMLTFTGDSYKGTYCHEMLSRLLNRRLLKQVFEVKLTELPQDCWSMIERITHHSNRPRRRQLEKSIADVISDCKVKLDTALKDPSHFVIANIYKPKGIRALSQNDEGPIPVEKFQGPTTFEEESDIFRSLSNEQVEAKFTVYAPVAYDNPREKRELQAKLAAPIKKCLRGYSNA